MPFSLAPALSAFVVLTIDPVATLQALDDPVATAAASKMVPQKYVGYVSKAVNAFDWKAPFHTYAIQLTSPTVPAACASQGISADMCTPLFPAANAHPHARAPLRLRGALPWSGGQQPSFMRSVVRVPVRVEDDAGAVFLEPADALRHRRIVAEEEARRRAFLGDSRFSQGSAAAGTAQPGYVEFSDLDEYTGDFTCPVPIDLLDSGSDSDADDCEEEERYYANAVEASRPPDTMVVVHVSYDLAQLDELPDPLHFFEEKRLLKRLADESRARKAGFLEVSTELPSKVSPGHDHVEPPANELQLIPHRDSRWSLWEYHKLLERFTTIRIPVSFIREVATKTRRLAVSLERLREDGLNWVQGWAGLF